MSQLGAEAPVLLASLALPEFSGRCRDAQHVPCVAAESPEFRPFASQQKGDNNRNTNKHTNKHQSTCIHPGGAAYTASFLVQSL